MYCARVDCPCRICEDRHEACHSDCRKYDFYKSRVNSVRKRVWDYARNRGEYLTQIRNAKTNNERFRRNTKNRKDRVLGGST